MISKEFIKNSIIYTIAGSLPITSGVILLPFYLKYLSIGIYGELAIYLTFSMLIQVLITYSFDNSIYVHYHDFKNDLLKLYRFISSAYVLMGIIGILVLILSVLLSPWLFKLLSNDNISFYPYGIISVITAIFQGFFKVYSSYLQIRQKPQTFLWLNLLSFSLVAVFTVAGLLIFPNQLIGPIVGRGLAAVLSGGYVLVSLFREFGFHFDFPLLKPTLRYNGSSFIYQVQMWVISYFDRILIMLYLTSKDVGVYDFAMKCFAVIDLILGALNNSFYPRVLSILADQKIKQTTPEINRYYHGLTSANMLMVGCAILAFPILFSFDFINKGYKDAFPYVSLLGVIYLIKSVRYYFGFPYGALKYIKPVPFIYLFISLLKIGFTLLFIRRWGLYALLGATFVSSLVEVTLSRLAIRSRIDYRFNYLKILVAPALFGSIILLGQLTPLSGSLVLNAGNLFICGLILLWFYKDEIKTLKITCL